MSYWISLNCELDSLHTETGGTYALGGTTDPELNVTYNYSVHYVRVYGENGIRSLEGMTAAESVEWLDRGIAELGIDTHQDYWKATEGNARAALVSLQKIALQAVTEGKGDSTWRVH